MRIISNDTEAQLASFNNSYNRIMINFLPLPSLSRKREGKRARYKERVSNRHRILKIETVYITCFDTTIKIMV